MKLEVYWRLNCERHFLSNYTAHNQNWPEHSLIVMSSGQRQELYLCVVGTPNFVNFILLDHQLLSDSLKLTGIKALQV